MIAVFSVKRLRTLQQINHSMKTLKATWLSLEAFVVFLEPCGEVDFPHALLYSSHLKTSGWLRHACGLSH
jgi:hypothetical protein